MSRNAVSACNVAVTLLVAGMGWAVSARAQTDVRALPGVMTPALDLDAIRAEDAQDELQGRPPRFAVPMATLIRPSTDGLWEDVDGSTVMWRMRIYAPDALSVNLGFTAYHMPAGGELRMYATDGSYALEPYTSTDNQEHGQLWTAVVLAEDIVVEVRLPRNVQDQLVLELTSINVGYRFFGQFRAEKSPDVCEIDVVCPIADLWRDEIPAIAVYTILGERACTGFMVNNTLQDHAPLFQTAWHCDDGGLHAASTVVYWNYHSPTCGQRGGGALSQSTVGGATVKAKYAPSDFTLLRLSSAPNPAYRISLAGWDRSGANATSVVAIHHPNTDEKCISFSHYPTTVTSYFEDTVPGDGTHLRVEWEPAAVNQGVTEPGSSGSPLFDQNRRVIGQLEGGYSYCGSPEMRDWYGRFYTSWTGGGSSATRLRDWLDPGNTGAMTMNTWVPPGLSVSPPRALDANGERGGPFAPGSIEYAIENHGTSAVNWTAGKTQAWVALSSVAGTLAAGAQTTVTISINSAADTFAHGVYTDTVTFTNTSDHLGDTARPVTLRVGLPRLSYSWNLETNPGWTTQGLWAWGHPTGGSGDYGCPDPTSGHTGTNVYGYNLSGGYTNSMFERFLTTAAFNCSNLTQVRLRFWRWLGVEESTWDHAYVRVSNNGSTYNQVWENLGWVDDCAWIFQELDIASYADSKPSVQVRWVMGPTDNSFTYCGWNIDDIEIWGVPPTGACCFADGSCTILPTSECVAQGGAYQGDDTTWCVPNTCLQPTGACCAGSVCTDDVSAADCQTLGGAFQGIGSACQPVPAACFGDADCSTRSTSTTSATSSRRWPAGRSAGRATTSPSTTARRRRARSGIATPTPAARAWSRRLRKRTSTTSARLCRNWCIRPCVRNRVEDSRARNSVSWTGR